jgi:hypothetical protein
MSASHLNDKNQAFHRLLHDLNQDSIHNEMEEERELLPKMSQSASLAELRGRLRKRYRSRISPNLMYMPRTAATAAILLTCAVGYLYIQRLREIKINEAKHPSQQIQLIDSLLRNRVNQDSIINYEKRH